MAEEIPKIAVKQIGEREGYGWIEVRLIVPEHAEPGEYSIPVTLDAEAVGSIITSNGYFTFEIASPGLRLPALIPDYMTYLFAGLLLAIVATAYLKGR